jgi:hypothetical protein
MARPLLTESRWPVLLGPLLLLMGWVGSAHGAEPSRDAGSYVLLAGSGLRIRGLRLASGDVGVNDGVLRTTGRLDAPKSALAASVVDLDPRSRCDALFFSGSVDRTAPGCGPGAPFSGPIVPDLAASCGFPELPGCATATPIHVGHGETRPLDPGTYGDVEVQGGGAGPGRLVLAGGEYVICGLRAARDAVIEVEAPARVLVDGNLAIGQSATIELAAGLAARDLTLFVGGQEVTFGRVSRISAHLCAPGSTLRIVDGANLTGSFVAGQIQSGRIRADLGSAPVGTTTSTTSASSSSTTTAVSMSTTTTTSTSSSSSSSTTTTTSATTSTTVASSTSTLVSTSTTFTTTSSSTTSSPSSSTTSSMSTSSTTMAGSTSTSATTTTTSGATTTTIGACTQGTTNRPFVVSFSAPDSSVLVQGLTVLVDYPEAKVTIPGSGNATSVRQAIINVQSGVLSQPNDLDDALRDVLAGTSHPLTPGNLFTINFFDCLNVPVPPTAADFTCTVEVATDPFGLPDQGVTCTVSAP